MPRVTAAPGDNALACTQCHAGTLNSGAGSVRILLQSGAVYLPGVKQHIQVQVSDPAQVRWGFQLSARLDSSPQSGQAGAFTPTDGLTQVICEDFGPTPCATGVSFIEHTSAGTRNGQKLSATFDFDWTPPAANAGTVTLYAAGNAANGNGSPAGDFIYTTSLQMSPVTAVAPVVTAGNVVSAATFAAGPVSPNSWVAVYGTNLAATTRAWAASDFVGGVMPFSLDGVSVLVAGAPRLAYVGYVSPTQVNFLLPSDLAAGTVQVSVRNSAGISLQVPLTIQAATPQLLTVDGKTALAMHANGQLVSASSPATVGETVTLNATGFGPTTPALIPGVPPLQTVPLATAPTATIGTGGATVSAAVVSAGSAGICQIAVQIPAGTASGSQAVTLQLGTFHLGFCPDPDQVRFSWLCGPSRSGPHRLLQPPPRSHNQPSRPRRNASRTPAAPSRPPVVPDVNIAMPSAY